VCVCVCEVWLENLKGGRETSVGIGAYVTSDIGGIYGYNLFRSQ